MVTGLAFSNSFLMIGACCIALYLLWRLMPLIILVTVAFIVAFVRINEVLIAFLEAIGDILCTKK